MQPGIRLTARDHAHLSRLITQSPAASVALLDTLEAELHRATLIEARDAVDLVQLGSRVTWETLETGRVRTAKLVLPRQQLDVSSELSVLTPIGCALIGLRVGDVFTWEEGARRWRLRVVAVSNAEVSP